MLIYERAVYVGQTVDFRRRMREHVKRSGNSSSQASSELIEEAGLQEIVVAVVARCPSHHEALVHEASWFLSARAASYRTPGHERWAKFPPYATKKETEHRWSITGEDEFPRLVEIAAKKTDPQVLLSLTHKLALEGLAANPSIERTCLGKPGHAAHVER